MSGTVHSQGFQLGMAKKCQRTAHVEAFWSLLTMVSGSEQRHTLGSMVFHGFLMWDMAHS